MFALNHASTLTIGPIVYHYEHRTVDKRFSFKSKDIGCHIEITEKELGKHFISGALVLPQVNVKTASTVSSQPYTSDFLAAREKHQKIAWKRYDVIQAIYDAGNPSNMRDTWPPIIEVAAIRAGFKKKPKWQTVRDWQKRFEAAGIGALVPGYVSRGANRKERSPQEIHFLYECVGKYFLNTLGSVRSAWKATSKAYLRAQREQAGAAGWECPSESAFRRLVNAISPYLVATRRFGKKQADRMFANVQKGALARYRLEVVEIDHTVLDTWVIDLTTGVILGRPTLTVAIDKYSRMIVGIYIGLEPPSAFSTMQCLRNMILPKDYMKEEFPEIVGEWPCCGIPTGLLSDNDLSFRDESYRTFCASLNITMLRGPAWRPDYRGIIERVNRTFKETSPLDLLPGKTNPKFWKFSDYDPRKHAVVSLHELRAIVHEWIVSEYMYTYHSGLGDIPLRVWQEQDDENPIRLPVSVKQLDMLLGVFQRRKLTRKGIEFLGLQYNSKEVNKLLRQKDWDCEISFRVNPANLGQISVSHPETRELFPVPCLSRAYAENLSLYEHKALRKKAAEDQRDFRNIAVLETMRIQSINNLDKILERASTKKRRDAVRKMGKDFIRQPATDINKPGTAEKIDRHSMGQSPLPDIETYGMSNSLSDDFDEADIPTYPTKE